VKKQEVGSGTHFAISNCLNSKTKIIQGVFMSQYKSLQDYLGKKSRPAKQSAAMKSKLNNDKSRTGPQTGQDVGVDPDNISL
jgi:ADP-glucose pyrophosphorylase